jgi:hypothetical protein
VTLAERHGLGNQQVDRSRKEGIGFGHRLSSVSQERVAVS